MFNVFIIVNIVNSKPRLMPWAAVNKTGIMSQDRVGFLTQHFFNISQFLTQSEKKTIEKMSSK